jgi:hypothetical protein
MPPFCAQINTHDKANLLDVKQIGKAGRLVRYILVKSAAQV